jgi:hypothetical protein
MPNQFLLRHPIIKGWAWNPWALIHGGKDRGNVVEETTCRA